MSAAESAAEAKAAGTTAFNAGDFAAAVTHYSSAISSDPTNHVFYSNRSAAYAKQEKYKEALLDANECIKLNPTWTRGYSRRGAAYVGLRNWRAALGAYEEGLKIEPENANMKKEAAAINQKLSGSASASAADGGMHSANPFPGGFPPSEPMPGAFEGTLVGPLKPALAALNAALPLLSLFYFIPLLGVARGHTCYQLAFFAILSTTLLGLWSSWPKTMATLKDPRFHASPELSLVILCVLLQMSSPIPFVVVPHACYGAHNTLRVFSATLLPRLPAFLRSRADWLLSDEGTQMTLALGSMSEVMVGLMTPLTIARTGMRSIASSYLFIQYLFKRYKTSRWTQLAINQLTEKLDGVMQHRFVPGIVGGLYGKLKGLVAGMAAR